MFPDRVGGVLNDAETGLPYAGDVDPMFFRTPTPTAT